MKFSANKDGAEQSDGFFRVQLQKTKDVYIMKEKHPCISLQSSFHFFQADKLMLIKKWHDFDVCQFTMIGGELFKS